MSRQGYNGSRYRGSALSEEGIRHYRLYRTSNGLEAIPDPVSLCVKGVLSTSVQARDNDPVGSHLSRSDDEGVAQVIVDISTRLFHLADDENPVRDATNIDLSVARIATALRIFSI